MEAQAPRGADQEGDRNEDDQNEDDQNDNSHSHTRPPAHARETHVALRPDSGPPMSGESLRVGRD